MNATPLKFALVALAVASTAIACTAADVPEPGEETAETSDALKKPAFGGGGMTSPGNVLEPEQPPPLPPNGCKAPAFKCGPENSPGCCIPGGGYVPSGVYCWTYTRPCPKPDPFGVWRCYSRPASGVCPY